MYIPVIIACTLKWRIEDCCYLASLMWCTITCKSCPYFDPLLVVGSKAVIGIVPFFCFSKSLPGNYHSLFWVKQQFKHLSDFLFRLVLKLQAAVEFDNFSDMLQKDVSIDCHVGASVGVGSQLKVNNTLWILRALRRSRSFCWWLKTSKPGNQGFE